MAGLRNAKWRVPAPPGNSALGHTPTRNENAPRARALVLVTARYLIAPNGDDANPILTMWFIRTTGWGKGSEVPAGIWRNLKNVSPGEGTIRTSARVVWFRSHEKPGAGESAEPESRVVAFRARGRRVMGRGC